MRHFRQPLLHWSLNLLLLAGFAAHLFSPVSGQVQKSAFAQWLDQNLVVNGEESEQDLRNHIRQLPSQYEEFPRFLEQATLLVLANQNDFQLPPQKRHDTDAPESGLWLLEAWTKQRDLPGRMSATISDFASQIQKWIVQGYSPQTADANKPVLSIHKGSVTSLFSADSDQIVSTLLGSIRINAP
ncbi:MAG: hypothetical protein WD315_01025 [Balneolaceae bacterium]